MTETVRARVLKQGHDRVFTGLYDERSRQFTKFAQGEEFDIAADIAATLTERGFVEVVALAALPGVPAPMRFAPGVTHSASTPPTFPASIPQATIPKVSGRPFPDVPEDEEARKTWSELAISRLERHAKRDTETGCLIWQGATHSTGYGIITLLRKTYGVHRLSWLAHRGSIAPGLFVCHSCDTPGCFEISHLFLGTPRQNTDDMVRKGRARYSGRPTLTKDQVAEIKRKLAERRSVVSLSREYGMCYRAISDIKHERSWRYVKPADKAN